jgi:hypothetical protein
MKLYVGNDLHSSNNYLAIIDETGKTSAIRVRATHSHNLLSMCSSDTYPARHLSCL